MEALGGIGWCLLGHGDAASVREMLSQVSPEQLKAPRLKGLQYILSLGDDAGNISGLIDRLVAEVKKNREGQAKAKLLEIFEALGNAHPLTLTGRRKLSTVLFS
jgi:putative thioredoxin